MLGSPPFLRAAALPRPTPGWTWASTSAVIARDIPKRPFALVGFPRAAADAAAGATSFNRAIRRSARRAGRRCIRAVYAIAVLAILHFFWMRAAKHDFAEVAVYAAIVAALLGGARCASRRLRQAGRRRREQQLVDAVQRSQRRELLGRVAHAEQTGPKASASGGIRAAPPAPRCRTAAAARRRRGTSPSRSPCSACESRRSGVARFAQRQGGGQQQHLVALALRTSCRWPRRSCCARPAWRSGRRCRWRRSPARSCWCSSAPATRPAR